MPDYRIFRLDDTGKTVGSSKRLNFKNDREAVREVRKTVNGATLEIWEGPRRIASISPNDEGPNSPRPYERFP
jgi:hypothetical protein